MNLIYSNVVHVCQTDFCSVLGQTVFDVKLEPTLNNTLPLQSNQSLCPW